MPVSIKGTGGGSVTLDAGAAAADTTLTIPNVTGTVLQSGTAVTAAQGGTGLTSVGTSGNVLTSNGTAWTSAAPAGGGLPAATAIGQIPFSTDGSTYTATQKIVQGTAVASTSGTNIDFTSIPSWVKRVTVMFNGMSTNGSSDPLVQIGAGSITTSGYSSVASYVATPTATSTVTVTNGFNIRDATSSAVRNGYMTITNVSGNIWVSGHTMCDLPNGASNVGAGGVTLSGTLDRIRITTTSGTDTFDAGSINILYE